MRYRRFGSLDFEVSALGFGCMRLPTLSDDTADIDEADAMRMVRYAIDQGVNYVDTAYPYHGGNSERFLGRALQDGYRERVKLATKLPCWLVNGPEDFDRLLDEQLERLQAEYVDFYLLHGLRTARWVKVRDFGVIDWAERAMANGRFQHLAFSFHGDTELLKEIVDYYDGWSMCQVQYNYMDIENQAGTEGVRYAASKGLAIVVMEGLLGGRLVDPPEQIQAIWDSAQKERTPADWALQWLWNQPEISTVLSGMSTMEQVEENLASADGSGLGTLTNQELDLFPRVRESYEALCPIPCTDCKYCMPCPNGVDIPGNFAVYNQGAMYDRPNDARGGYRFMQVQVERGEIETNPQAVSCIQCRECEEKCPQSIAISEWMPIIHDVLGEGKPYVCGLPAS
jgi:predicted aldo/keto reductase-like oxidoreductase